MGDETWEAKDERRIMEPGNQVGQHTDWIQMRNCLGKQYITLWKRSAKLENNKNNVTHPIPNTIGIANWCIATASRDDCHFVLLMLAPCSRPTLATAADHGTPRPLWVSNIKGIFKLKHARTRVLWKIHRPYFQILALQCQVSRLHHTWLCSQHFYCDVNIKPQITTVWTCMNVEWRHAMCPNQQSSTETCQNTDVTSICEAKDSR